MIILGLKILDFMRIGVAEIEPTGKVIKITGMNGSGKSSALKAIWAVLGGKRFVPGEPVRRGAEKAEIVITLGKKPGAEVDYTITKTMEPGKSDTLSIVPMKPGMTPQKFLDSLIDSSFAFDPLAFADKKPEEQFQILRQIVPLTDEKGKPLDIDALDAQNEEDYKTRGRLNLQVKALDAKHASIEVPRDTPDMEIDVSSLAQKVQAASKKNAEIDLLIARRQDAVKTAERNKTAATTRIAELEAAIKEAKANHERATQRLIELAAEKDEPKIDVSAEIKAIESANEVNRHVANKRKRLELTAESKGLDKEADALTEAMEARKRSKMHALANAKFPVKGLSFGEKMVLFDGLPFDQASTAVQIQTCLGIGMQKHSELQAMFIREGALIDPEKFKIIEAMTKKWDGQIWCEIATADQGLGIVMQDGMILKVNKEKE